MYKKRLLKTLLVMTMFGNITAYAAPEIGPAADTIDIITDEETATSPEVLITDSETQGEPETEIEETTIETDAETDASAEEETEELLEEDIEEEEETGNYKNIKLHFSADIKVDTDKTPIYSISVQIPNGLMGSDGQEDHDVIMLTENDGFQCDYDAFVYEDDFQFTSYVLNDNAFLYKISYEGIEQADFFGKPMWNTGIIKNVQEGGNYNIKLIVENNPDAEVTDANLAETKSEFHKDISSGKYGESRAAELESKINEVLEQKDVETDHSNLFKGIIILVVVIGAGAGAVWYYIKKVRDADDDD